MKNWRKRFKATLKALHKEDIFYLESYLVDFIEEEIETAKVEVLEEVLEHTRLDTKQGKKDGINVIEIGGCIDYLDVVGMLDKFKKKRV